MTEQAKTTDEDLIIEYMHTRRPLILNELFSRYLDVGFRTAMRYMKNKSDAEDVLQLAFIQFLNNLSSFREGSTTIKPWLMKMIVNTSIKKLQEENSRKHRQEKVATQRFSQYSQKNDEVVELSKREELKNKIKNIVDMLPEKYRSPIWLVLYEGFTYPEVATVLSLPEKTVRTQVARGIERLKNLLGTMGTMLSADAICVLISNSSLELAPETTKKILETPELYNLNATKSPHSVQLGTFSNSANLSPKIISTIFLMFIAGIAIYGLLPNNNKNKNISTNTQTDNNETNQVWQFSNKKDRDLPLLIGRWDWSQKLNSMATSPDEIILISLPISTQTKAFLVECLSMPNITTKQPHSNLYLSAFWFKGNEILNHECLTSKGKYTLSIGQTFYQKFYFYKNQIYSFVNEKCVRINNYKQNISGSTVAIISRNIAFFKITSLTLEKTPEHILHVNKNDFNDDSEEHLKNWPINEKSITLK